MDSSQPSQTFWMFEGLLKTTKRQRSGSKKNEMYSHWFNKACNGHHLDHLPVGHQNFRTHNPHLRKVHHQTHILHHIHRHSHLHMQGLQGHNQSYYNSHNFPDYSTDHHALYLKSNKQEILYKF